MTGGDADGGRDDRAAVVRTCAATRRAKPVEELIRFVRAPDGTVVPDLKRKLPGRGVWVTASRTAVASAVRRKAFGRAFRAEVAVDPQLAESVGALLERTALDMLGLANKAGRVVTGTAKIEAALGGGGVAALLHAADAAPDGVRKLDAVLRRSGSKSPTLTFCRGELLDLALGRSNVVHAALLASPVSDAFLDRAERLMRYRAEGGAVSGRHEDTGQPAGTDTND